MIQGFRSPSLAAFLLLAPLAFIALPDELQTRFETIVGPKNVEESGQGRLQGFLTGLDLYHSRTPDFQWT